MKRNDDTPASFEHELSTMLRQTGEGFEPDPLRLAEGGLRRGRTRVFRRRAGIVAGAASVALLSVGAVQLTGGGQGTPVAATPENSEEMIETLSAMLPEGVEVTSSEAESPRGLETPSIHLTLRDSVPGEVTLGVTLHRWAIEDFRVEAGCVVPDEPGYHCSQQDLDDGSVLTHLRWDWHGMEDMPDMTTWNATLEKEGPFEDVPSMRSVSVDLDKDLSRIADPDSYQPLLDEDQLAAIATAPVWQQVFDLVDDTQGAPADDDFDPEMVNVAPEVLRDLFRDLAPERLTVTDGVWEEEEAPGEVSLVVDDGDGPAYVSILLWASYEPYEPYDPGMGYFDSWDDVELSEEERAVLDELDDCRNEPVDDGTDIRLCDLGPSEGDPTGIWSASVVFPDGGMVDITVTNMPGLEDDDVVSRPDSPLTMEELREIVLAPEWRDLFE
ncbi:MULTISPECIES: hypothetical protein [unclassified Streptomyces]|jgi:hypothetical protein|uniref:hypothetical protein n=1 Tax=unclassified Streptomyces TaxID=2593676 RepID=UPI0019086DF6|nr:MULTISPECIES: hypothetical protein [unclassified Streptomyces]MCU4747929.1 hypothetical protein [Streptomyces sp. G-5]QQN78539.1 hypothetical protein IPZ77_14595 [Streptomyces sp. XC 2026]